MSTNFQNINGDAESPSFWNERYESQNIPWDLNSSNPAFVSLLNEKKFIKPCSILIPGCGRGFDAIAAAKAGYDVTAVDFSQPAITYAKSLAEKEGVKIKFIIQDIFAFANNEDFDAVYDYTMFCAINPKRRVEYAKKVFSLLKPGGTLVAILFPVEKREGGPPYEIDILETYKIFSRYGKLEFSSKNINSVDHRKGREVLQIYLKK